MPEHQEMVLMEGEGLNIYFFFHNRQNKRIRSGEGQTLS